MHCGVVQNWQKRTRNYTPSVAWKNQKLKRNQNLSDFTKSFAGIARFSLAKRFSHPSGSRACVCEFSYHCTNYHHRQYINTFKNVGSIPYIHMNRPQRRDTRHDENELRKKCVWKTTEWELYWTGIYPWLPDYDDVKLWKQDKFTRKYYK